MNNFTRNHPIAQGIFITFGLLASLASTAQQSVAADGISKLISVTQMKGDNAYDEAMKPSTEKVRASASVSGAASAAQPDAAIQNSIASPAPTGATQMKKAVTPQAITPGALQSLNPQPLPPGGGLIKPMPGASMDMAKPRIDSGINALPRLIQPAVGIGGKTGAEKTTPYVRPDMAALATPTPPGRITGASVNVTSSVDATLRIEGNGRCALNVIEMHNGGQGPAPIWPRRVDAPPSYIGPLPTQIKVRTNVVGLDFLTIESAGGPEGCAGYASVRL